MRSWDCISFAALWWSRSSFQWKVSTMLAQYDPYRKASETLKEDQVTISYRMIANTNYILYWHEDPACSYSKARTVINCFSTDQTRRRRIQIVVIIHLITIIAIISQKMRSQIIFSLQDWAQRQLASSASNKSYLKGHQKYTRVGTDDFAWQMYIHYDNYYYYPKRRQTTTTAATIIIIITTPRTNLRREWRALL